MCLHLTALVLPTLHREIAFEAAAALPLFLGFTRIPDRRVTWKLRRVRSLPSRRAGTDEPPGPGAALSLHTDNENVGELKLLKKPCWRREDYLWLISSLCVSSSYNWWFGCNPKAVCLWGWGDVWHFFYQTQQLLNLGFKPYGAETTRAFWIFYGTRASVETAIY